MQPKTSVDFAGRRRIHIGLPVRDLEQSKRFYTTLFGTGPSKERPGYAKFEPADPPVNLSLNELPAVEPPRDPVSHFGIQVKTPEAVQQALRRFRAAGLETRVEQGTTCCYAVQDKVWATDPDGNRWEVFVVLDADAPRRADATPNCCAPATETLLT